MDFAPRFRYLFADLTIVSSIALPEIATAGAGSVASDLRFDVLGRRKVAQRAHGSDNEGPDDEAWPLAPVDMGDDCMLRFPRTVDFCISNDGTCVSAWVDPDTDDETLRHLLLDQVFPRVLAFRRRLVIHGATVIIGDGGACLVGESGRGKSTLAASFDTAGFPIASDDGVMLVPTADGAQAWPLYSSLRMWPETVSMLYAEPPTLSAMAHYSTKRRVLLPSFDRLVATDVPLRAVFVLEPERASEVDAVTVVRLSPREACMAIVSNAFLLDPTNHGQVERVLVEAGEIARRVPVFAVSYRRDFAVLPEVRAAILSACKF